MDTPDIPVGDAERKRALDELAQHFSNGDLSDVEFDRRGSAIARAATRADIDYHLADLPALAHTGAHADEQQPQDSGLEDSGELNPSPEELTDLRRRHKKVQRVDAFSWSLLVAVCVLHFFVAGVPYFWVVFIVSFALSAGARQVFDLSFFEEEHLMLLKGEEKEERCAAAERRGAGRPKEKTADTPVAFR